MAVITNPDLLQIVKLGRAATGRLLEYPLEDRQPSVSFLLEDARQAMLAVFNWIDVPLSHTFRVPALDSLTGTVTSCVMF